MALFSLNLFLPSHMSFSNALPLPRLPQFAPHLSFAHGNIAVGLDEVRDILPKPVSRRLRASRRKDQVAQLGGRDERVGRGHWVCEVQRLLRVISTWHGIAKRLMSRRTHLVLQSLEDDLDELFGSVFLLLPAEDCRP